jgi:hypothetical protein
MIFASGAGHPWGGFYAHHHLIFPDLGSANIAFKLLAKLGGTETLGPILMGMARPVHLLPRDAEVELIVKVAAIAVVDAQETEQHGVRLERTKALAPAT